MVQALFSRPSSTSSAIRVKTLWVDASWNLKKSDLVTFRGEDEKWLVDTVYDIHTECAELEQKWGLDLPKSQRTER